MPVSASTPPALRTRSNLRSRLLTALGLAFGLLLTVTGASTLASSPVPDAVAANTPYRVVTWGASPYTIQDPPEMADRTVRNLVHTSLGGSGVRISLSNAYGDRAVTFDAVRVALHDSGAAVVADSSHVVKFDDGTSVTIQPGQEVLSDPLDWELAPDITLAISIHVVDDPGVITGHRLAMQTSYLSDSGDATDDEDGSSFTTEIASWYWVETVSVEAARGVSTLAFLGDSITDGHSSSVGANLRWPDQFADGIADTRYGHRFAVMNQGISANKVLADGTGDAILHRFERDVLDQPGVSTVVIMAGINDIRWDDATKPAHLVKAYRTLIERAHARGICVVASTLVPFGGSSRWTEAREEVRTGFNDWIRETDEFDATLDFDAAVRDPDDPEKFRPGYGAPDHLHPTDDGYAAMAASVDPGLLTCSR